MNRSNSIRINGPAAIATSISAVILIALFLSVIFMFLSNTLEIKAHTRATALLDVPELQQEQFISLLKRYAYHKHYRIYCSEPPNHRWHMYGVIMITRNGDHVSVVNATSAVQFSIIMDAIRNDSHWKLEWSELKLFLGERYIWKDTGI